MQCACGASRVAGPLRGVAGCEDRGRDEEGVWRMTGERAGLRMRALFVLKWGLAAALLGGISTQVVAGPLEELKASSAVEGVDARRLLHGEILTARGTQGSFARGVYVESCYFLKAAPDGVKTTLLHWDPSKYKETEVSAYRSYRWPAEPEVFKAMRLNSAVAADRTLLAWTTGAVKDNAPGELHLRREELDAFRQTLAGHDAAKAEERDALVNAAWQGLLQRHSDAVGAGGLAALPSYKAGGVNIAAADEFRSLLKMTPEIAARFTGLTGARPLAAGGAGAVEEIAPYAEESLVRGHTSFCLGAAAAEHSAEGGGWQVLDLTYYTADTYFLSFSLYQLWPWEGGTLVWEVDYASAPFRGYLGGIDRVVAGKEMTKDSSGSVATLRKELAALER